MENWQDFLLSHSEEGFINGAVLRTAAERFGKSLKMMEILSLQEGIIPRRYERNIGTISIEQQIKLLQSSCLIIGCGGLGGYILEELGRLGVGSITALDPDVFQESNLNRQLLANVENIGIAKVAAAQARILQINPAVDFHGRQEALDADNVANLLAGVDVVIDALDNFETRRVLLNACAQSQIPLVGGGIAGWYGIVYYSFQTSAALEAAFMGVHHTRGIEAELGNPPFIPALVASLESALVARLLIGNIQGKTAGKMFFIDLLDMSFEVFEV